MQIRVLGSNLDVGGSLTEYVTDHLDKTVKKFFDKAVSSEVHFKKEGHLFKVVLIINEGVKMGVRIKSDGEAGDAYGAFHEASKKAENQLRRYHSRIKDYNSRIAIKEIEPDYKDYKSLNATKYVLPPLNYDVYSEMEQEEANKKEANSHKIVSEKSTAIEELKVEEAIMKMDLADLPALVFINKDNGRMNVVYHRKDGLISLIDPQL